MMNFPFLHKEKLPSIVHQEKRQLKAMVYIESTQPFNFSFKEDTACSGHIS
jgi:hypothetical protein